MTEPKTTFTPGPWSFSFESTAPEWAIVTTAGGSIVANVNADHRQMANAALIAAAPDMYAAIQEYLRFYDAYDGSADSYVAMNDAVEALRAALARANGEG